MYKLKSGNTVVAEIADVNDLTEMVQVQDIKMLEHIPLNQETGAFDQWSEYPDEACWGRDKDGRIFILTGWLRVECETADKKNVVYAQRFCIHQADDSDELEFTALYESDAIFFGITKDVFDALVLVTSGEVADLEVDSKHKSFKTIVKRCTISPTNRELARKMMIKHFIFDRGENPVAAGKLSSDIVHTIKPVKVVKVKDGPVHAFTVAMANEEKPAIGIWEENSEVGGHHTFGYWVNHVDAYQHRKTPELVVKLDILENGNYPHDPTPAGFNKWKKACMEDKSHFTPEGYDKFMTELYAERDKKLAEKQAEKDKRDYEAAEKKKKRDEEAAKKKAEKEEAKKKREAEKAEKKKQREEEAAKKKEEQKAEAAKKKEEREAEKAKKKKEQEEAAAKKKAEREEKAAKQKAEREEKEAKKKAEREEKEAKKKKEREEKEAKADAKKKEREEKEAKAKAEKEAKAKADNK